MLDMLAALDKKTNSHRKEEATSHAALKPSEFSSTTTAASQKLTMDSLLNPLASTSEKFASIRSSMQSLDAAKTTHALQSTVVTDRASRKLAYEATSKDVSNWMETVKANREAETLDFRPKNRARVTTNSLVNKFTPENDFERQIQEALEGAGAEDETKLVEAEEALAAGIARGGDDDDADFDDDLGSNTNLTLEEFKKRHGQLAKMRSLLFYEERKRHQINKIKSKKYRKIRKKQNEKEKVKEMEVLREQDPELARELDEREATKRMKERMTLAHKNTSKWARQQLRRGNIDTDTRKALSAQVAIGDKLRQKQMGEEVGSDDDGDSSGDEDEDEDERLKRKARKVLKDVEGDDEKEEREKQKSGLFKLAFMQKGIETQREKAKREAMELLDELERGEGEGQEDDDVDNYDDEEEEEEEEEEGGKERKGERTTIVGEGIEIDLDDDDEDDDEDDEKNTGVGKEVTRALTKKNTKKEDPKDGGFDIASNPWMGDGKTDKKAKKKGKKEIDSSIVDLDAGISMIVGDDADSVDMTTQNPSDDEDDEDGNNDEPGKSKLEKLSQSELVARAFAAPDDIEEDFKKEKQALIDRDDPNKKAVDDDKVQGWGSWTGAGVRKPKKRKKLSKKLEAPKVKKVKRADDKLPTVIINEKRMKKMSKFKVASVPYPFTSAEQYERAMAGPVGADWQTSQTVVNMTRPEILTKAGRIINPIGKIGKNKASDKRKARF